MPKLNATRHDDLQDRQAKSLADMLNHSEQPFNPLLDFSICEGRQLPIQDSGTHRVQILLAGVEQESAAQLPIEDFFPSKSPHGTKGVRQAVNVATQLSMELHGWKQTGEKSPFRAFEHRWPHRRDHAEGRNHRLLSN